MFQGMGDDLAIVRCKSSCDRFHSVSVALRWLDDLATVVARRAIRGGQLRSHELHLNESNKVESSGLVGTKSGLRVRVNASGPGRANVEASSVNPPTRGGLSNPSRLENACKLGRV